MHLTCKQREVDIGPGLLGQAPNRAWAAQYGSIFHGLQERIQVVFFLVLAVIPELAQIV
jgi:hypothetical protein